MVVGCSVVIKVVVVVGGGGGGGVAHAHGSSAMSQQLVSTVNFDTPEEPAQSEMHVLFVTAVSHTVREPRSHWQQPVGHVGCVQI